MAAVRFVGCEVVSVPLARGHALNHVGAARRGCALYRNGLPYALTGTEKLNVEHLTDVKRSRKCRPTRPPAIPRDRVRIVDGPFNGQPATIHKTAKNGESYKIIVSLFRDADRGNSASGNGGGGIVSRTIRKLWEIVGNQYAASNRPYRPTLRAPRC